mmetsp:Transcript_2049/g.5977  ORF Transcript_2049/g.5977 Transcript_2049/m.5977 type:complete len:281 (+) Transcript_2049:365-1207(+)
MTLTRLTQLPTLCVTGITLCRMAYETSTSPQRAIPAKISGSATPGVVSAAAVGPKPSSSGTTPTSSGSAMNVTSPNMSMPPSRSCGSKSLRCMIALESTLRPWKARLDAMAARKPAHVKEISVTEAIITPATMGTSASNWPTAGVAPSTVALSSTVKKGSSALMVCVNDTATEPSDMLVASSPAACSAASGAHAASTCGVAQRGSENALAAASAAVGRLLPLSRRRPKANQTHPIAAAATTPCAAVHVAGYGKTSNTCLLNTLYAMLHAYHEPKSTPSAM